MLTYTPEAGTQISFACEEAINIADRHHDEVSFDFNGVNVIAKPGGLPGALVQEWSDIQQRQAEEYRKTPEYKEKKLQRDKEVATKSARIKELLEDFAPLVERAFLDKAIEYRMHDLLPSNPHKYLEKIIDWIDEFTPLADDIGVQGDYDTTLLAQQLEAAGFFEGEGVGQDPEWFSTREKMGRYIIGQVLSFLKKGMSPHPMTNSFIEKYRELPT